jgi:Tfp pilus assembly protein PilW
MISLVLGLVLIGGVLGLYLSSREMFRTNESLARV